MLPNLQKAQVTGSHGYSLEDRIYWFIIEDNPAIVGFDAPIKSVAYYIPVTGDRRTFIKIGQAITDWLEYNPVPTANNQVPVYANNTIVYQHYHKPFIGYTTYDMGTYIPNMELFLTDTVGEQSITNVWVNIKFNRIHDIKSTNYFLIGTDIITILNPGTYKISSNVSLYTTKTGSRAEGITRIIVYENGAWVLLRDSSVGYTFHYSTTQTNATTQVIGILTTSSQNTKIAIQSIRNNGTSTLNTRIQGSTLSIDRVDYYPSDLESKNNLDFGSYILYTNNSDVNRLLDLGVFGE